MKTLVGHTSQDSALICSDYPYGFRLRCQIRYWVETKKGFGQRFVSQTLNPKTGKWNKPKAGTYNVIAILIEDEIGHVGIDVLHSGGWDKEDVIKAFEQRHAEALGEYEKAAIKYIRATNEMGKYVKYTVRAVTDNRPRQSEAEGEAILDAALLQGFRDVEVRENE